MLASLPETNMDVRCERCATVYEFDDAQVGPNGVTVKCAQCGHLFKVRRKASDTPTMTDGGPFTTKPGMTPAPIPVGRGGPAPKPPGPPPPGGPSLGLTQPHSPPVAPPPKPGASSASPASPPAPGSAAATPTMPQGSPPQLPPPTAAGAYEFWTVKLASSGEVFRFREMTTLQQWIVERKVGRDDAISRTGDVWRKLGTIPELDPFFNIVDRALQAGGMPKADPEEATTTVSYPPPGPAKKLARAGSEASLLGDMSGPVAFGGHGAERTDPNGRVPRKPLPVAAIAGGAVVIVMAIVLGIAFRGKGDKHKAVVAQARQLYALDTDDGFRQAAAMLTRAKLTDDQDPQVSAALAEVKATWASYLRDDARLLEQTPAAATAAQSFRREAQAHLDEAKKAAADALAASPDGAEPNRATALVLCVDGSPVPEVQRYIKRASEKLPNDTNLAMIEAMLAQREGKTEEAKQKLTQANQLAMSTSGKPSIPASVGLAKLAINAKQMDDAQRLLKSALDTNPQHDRAKALLAQATGGPAPLPTPTPSPTPTPPGPTVTPVAVPTPTPNPNPTPTPSGTSGSSGTSGASVPEGSTNVEKIIAAAEKNLENGRTAEARKLYEKALALDPRNVEALTGLGYADLDKERFMSAVDNFKKALDVVPDYGEAIIGMAESYKVRGDRDKAIEYYKRYIKVLPGGGKAGMAKANLRELEASAPKSPPPEPTPEKSDKPEKKEEPEAKAPPKAEPKPEAGE